MTSVRRHRRSARRLAPLAAALMLAWVPVAAQDQPAPEQPPPAETDGPVVPYEVELTGVEDGGLSDLLRGTSSLFTLKENPPPSLLGLERRAEADRERLQTALRSAGHYDAELDVRVDGAAQPARVTIAVQPGPAYRFKTVTIATADGSPVPGGPVDPGELGLTAGETARAPAVVDAQSRLIAEMAKRGYAFAKVPDRRAVVDHSDRRMDVTYTLDPGPITRFGEAGIEGLEGVDADLIRGRLPWRPGQLYDPALVDRARTDIAKLDVFETVRVALAPEPGPDGVTPVTVVVAERKRHFIGAGVTYSTSEGFGAQAYWGHRNLFGGAERLRIGAEIGRLSAQSAGSNALETTDLRFNVLFRKPDFLAVKQSLVLGWAVVSEQPPAYDRVGTVLSALLEREVSDQLTVSYGVSWDRSKEETTDRSYQSSLIGVPLTLNYNGSNDLLNPTSGFRIGVQATPWIPAGGKEAERQFLSTTVSGTVYHDIAGDGRYVAAARAQVGGIVGAGLAAIPPSKRFYAGGGGSVRGYAFQKVGPRDRAGDPIGGRSLFETGIELRIKVTDTIGVVPFVDAGAVYDRAFPDFSQPLRVGAGIGLRYYTDFGPLRVDVGFPLNRERDDSTWQLYLSLGQAF
ncbi:autotransporter assembly complex family protein [Azospirillum sp.]|uniref:autotransporter assembly complex protein TamA n=1 Tax=Azospirillum sp. TaxID=34012 RepID=UPI002D4137D6|nr:autotransporter assembly complex family protein [Azospirillum sp.]HYD65998.1 autotransporter assembly complex family protein [Azospirillum sp.]